MVIAIAESLMRASTLIFFTLLLILLLIVSCKNNSEKNNSVITLNSFDSTSYLNHNDSARYVGINTCKQCHQQIYTTYIKTGMGNSFGLASKEKSAADYSYPHIIDKLLGLQYAAFWKSDSLHFMEFELSGHDTTFKRIEQVNYIIGSGQHTNSHLQAVNGYVNQMPMTFYTQKKKWDLPPGFENGHNTRFTRKIGLECMSCHNAYPDFVLGSENKFKSVPVGIDCERCHGPGSIHVAQRKNGNNIDTSKYIDYSIVNPAKLSIDRQFDLCQRCHLQGNAVLKEGKSFYDFKPGMKLSDYISVFLPRYKNADDEFIMASHVDRLKQSKCFIKSLEMASANEVASTGSSNSSANQFKPYKEALTCVTCHNPHVSVRETNKEVFNNACNRCHTSDKSKISSKISAKIVLCSEAQSLRIKSKDNCVSCHMPSSGSTDIPHVSVHDHYIRKPITKKEKDKIKKFIGLCAINEKNPSALTRAWAYINQYNKFDNKEEFLDSAQILLKDNTKDDINRNIYALLQLHFSKLNFSQIIKYVNLIGENELFDRLNKQTYDNLQAWAAYQIAESYYNAVSVEKSIRWFEKAKILSPFNLEFRNKLGSAYMNAQRVEEAKKEFNYIINENPKYISAYTNLGFVELSQNNVKAAQALYNKALKLDANYEPLLFNVAGLKAYLKDYNGAIVIIHQILKKNPGSQKAKKILNQLKSMN